MGIGHCSSVSNTKRKLPPGSPQRPSAKRTKRRLRIGSLPNDILSSITSKLSLKEAARTSILSSQWRRVWLCRAYIDLNHHTVLSESDKERSWTTPGGIRLNRRKFIKSVGALLQQHEGVGTEDIRIRHDLCDRYAGHINRLVNYTIASKAKGLILELWGVNFGPTIVRCNFPLQVLDTKNSNLRRLELWFVSLNPPAGYRGFQNLTKLCLRDVNITNEDVQRLLSEGNRLECFRITNCKMLTSLRIPHCLNRLKVLLVLSCPLLQDMALDCGVPALHYRGSLIPMEFAAPLKLRQLWIELLTCHSALGFIFNELPTTLPHLEMLTLTWTQLERVDSVSRLSKFRSLHHLILNWTIFGSPRRTTDILVLGCLLEAAPFMEKLELHMVMDCFLHKRYCHEDGELRSPPSCPHSHLSLVNISGFIGL